MMYKYQEKIHMKENMPFDLVSVNNPLFSTKVLKCSKKQLCGLFICKEFLLYNRRRKSKQGDCAGGKARMEISSNFK